MSYKLLINNTVTLSVGDLVEFNEQDSVVIDIRPGVIKIRAKSGEYTDLPTGLWSNAEVIEVPNENLNDPNVLFKSNRKEKIHEIF